MNGTKKFLYIVGFIVAEVVAAAAVTEYVNNHITRALLYGLLALCGIAFLYNQLMEDEK